MVDLSSISVGQEFNRPTAGASSGRRWPLPCDAHYRSYRYRSQDGLGTAGEKSCASVVARNPSATARSLIF